MNKKFYTFISKEEYERLQRIRKLIEKRGKTLPITYTLVYKQAEDGSYYRPKPIQYEVVVQMLIREKYSINEELALLRQRDEKPEEFKVYFDYAEQCKLQAKQFVKERENWGDS